MRLAGCCLFGLVMSAFVAGPAIPMELIIEGEGRLAIDPEQLRSPELFDYDGDGDLELPTESGYGMYTGQDTLRVYSAFGGRSRHLRRLTPRPVAR